MELKRRSMEQCRNAWYAYGSHMRPHQDSSPVRLGGKRPVKPLHTRGLLEAAPPRFNPSPISPQCSRVLRESSHTLALTRGISRPLVHSHHEYLVHRRSTPYFATTLGQIASAKYCWPLDGCSIYKVVGHHPEISLNPLLQQIGGGGGTVTPDRSRRCQSFFRLPRGDTRRQQTRVCLVGRIEVGLPSQIRTAGVTGARGWYTFFGADIKKHNKAKKGRFGQFDGYESSSSPKARKYGDDLEPVYGAADTVVNGQLSDIIEGKVEGKRGLGKCLMQIIDSLKQGRKIKFQDLKQEAADRKKWLKLFGQWISRQPPMFSLVGGESLAAPQLRPQLQAAFDLNLVNLFRPSAYSVYSIDDVRIGFILKVCVLGLRYGRLISICVIELTYHDCNTNKRGDRRKKPPTSGIVYHNTHIRKSGSDPNGNRIWFTLLGGEQANCSDNVIRSR
ncbi:hypothetical protein PR048_013426 [Dryococelus australis]|uniref:Ribosomal protein S3 n=1 Tax=Dryococelus australis TaxID=614101 RepID=A0ABQ9HT02_9NEOP|nr:hypothetical protein PR048_013426 [Dryococelus australis]